MAQLEAEFSPSWRFLHKIPEGCLYDEALALKPFEGRWHVSKIRMQAVLGKQPKLMRHLRACPGKICRQKERRGRGRVQTQMETLNGTQDTRPEPFLNWHCWSCQS